MLDPNSTTRFTLEEIHSHPWMTGVCRKVLSSLPCKTRRQAVCYESGGYICKELQKFNKCNCSCHCSKCPLLGHHCGDCTYIQANDPDVMLRRSIRLSSIPNLIFGSSPDMSSPFLKNSPIDLSHLNFHNFELSPIEGKHISVSHKNSIITIESMSIITNKTNLCKFNYPAIKNSLDLSEGSEEDDKTGEDVVFV